MDDGLLDRIRQLWATMGGAGVGFEPGAVTIGMADRSSICPPDWVGALRMGDAALIVAPDEARFKQVSAAAAKLAPRQVCDPAFLPVSTSAGRVLGPAELAYLEPARFRPVSGSAVVEIEPADAAELEAASSEADVNEAKPTAAAMLLAIVDDIGVAAVCGYEAWRDRIAHMIVLTHPARRGRGLARVVSSAATTRALAAGLIPQWRSRVPASQRIAASLGYERIGNQLSFHIPAV